MKSLKESFEQSITPKYQVRVSPVKYEPEPKKPKVWIGECERVFNFFKFKHEWVMYVTFPTCWRELADTLQTYITNELELEVNITNENVKIYLPSKLLENKFYYELRDWLMYEGHILKLWDKNKYSGYGFDSKNYTISELFESFDLPVDAECRYCRWI